MQSMRIEHGDDGPGQPLDGFPVSPSLTIYALNIRDDEDPEQFMAEHSYDFVVIPEADSIEIRRTIDNILSESRGD